MVSIDDLLGCDLTEAAETAASVVPDVVSSLDRLVPLLATGGDRSALRRYLIAGRRRSADTHRDVRQRTDTVVGSRLSSDEAELRVLAVAGPFA